MPAVAGLKYPPQLFERVVNFALRLPGFTGATDHGVEETSETVNRFCALIMCFHVRPRNSLHML